jgi:hypothetical protein
MSLNGFLRALLYQLLTQHPELILIVFPRHWASLYSKALREEPDTGDLRPGWSLRQLTNALKALGDQKIVLLKICFLVDGLDEFDGNHDEIGRLFDETIHCSNIKICLSSRSWVVFEDLFRTCPKLRLQNLTHRDIQAYVNDKLSLNKSFQRVARENPEEASRMSSEIIQKADGVFFWIRLVVQYLLNRIRNRDELTDLWQRLSLFPRELEPLYYRLLELIEPVYLPWVSRTFQILRVNTSLLYYPFGQA